MPGAKNQWVFEHEHFQRGRKENLKFIVRKVPSSKAAAKSSQSGNNVEIAQHNINANNININSSENKKIAVEEDLFGLVLATNEQLVKAFADLEEKVNCCLQNQDDILRRLRILQTTTSGDGGGGGDSGYKDCHDCSNVSSLFGGMGNINCTSLDDTDLFK